MEDKDTIILTLSQLDDLNVVIIIPDSYAETGELQVIYDTEDCKFTEEQIKEEVDRFLHEALKDKEWQNVRKNNTI